MKRIGIMLTPTQASRLSKASEQTEITVSELIRKLIDYHLSDIVSQSLDTNLRTDKSRELAG